MILIDIIFDWQADDVSNFSDARVSEGLFHFRQLIDFGI